MKKTQVEEVEEDGRITVDVGVLDGDELLADKSLSCDVSEGDELHIEITKR